MPDLNIKDIPTEVLETLAQRAKEQNISRTQLIRDLLLKLGKAHYVYFSAAKIKEEITKRCQETTPSKERFNAIARRDLQRYYQLLNLVPWEFPKLQTNELCLLIDAFNGKLNDFNSSPREQLVSEFTASCEYSDLGQKWQVDYQILRSKLEQLEDLQAAWLLDKIEQFWTDKFRANGNYETTFQDLGLFQIRKPNFSPTHAISKGSTIIALLMWFEDKFFTAAEWHNEDSETDWEITGSGIFYQGNPQTIEYQLLPIKQ